MTIKNFSQLKRALANNYFEIVEHYVHPEYTGQVRFVSKMRTNGMYTHSTDGSINAYNDHRGSWCDFGKASDWTFDGELCTFAFRGRKVWTIRVLETEASA